MLARVKRVTRDRISEKNLYKIKRIKDLVGYKVSANSYNPVSSYAIVAPVYNVSPYLEDFLKSVIGQSIKRDRLQLIMVDDGSTDESPSIIRAWQQRYPELIQYVRKENGGLPSARNAGMPFVEADWVTFADPDDFLPADYFEKIDKVIAARPELMLLGIKEVFYNERTRTVVDNHPLKNRFEKGNRFYRFDDEEHLPIIESANRSLYRMEEIRRQNLTADERIKPSFEDGHFTNKYILGLEHGSIGFLRNPIYYYRKREAANSLLDTSWSKPEKVLNQTKLGYLDLLRFAKEAKGYVPENIQITVMYDLAWYLRYYVDHPERSAFLSSDEVDEAYGIMSDVFSYIDQGVIFSRHNNRMGFEHKNAWVQGFKHERPLKQRVYLRRVDQRSRLLHFIAFSDDVTYSLSGVRYAPNEIKATSHSYLGRELYRSYEVYLAYNNLDEELELLFGNAAQVEIDVRGKVFENGAKLKDIVDHYAEKWPLYMPQEDIWIVMDRDTQADDNGEHFYRYLKKHHPEQKALFALRKTSKDWQRLKKEGFELLDFGSKGHEEILKRCSTIISSHLDNYVTSYYNDQFCLTKDIICLQHGILRSDLSSWFNTKREVNLFITSTEFEYDSIVADGSSYIQSSREVALTGLPRHDALLKKAETKEPGEHMVLIMPTWRKGLMGDAKDHSNERAVNPEFSRSPYCKHWEDVLRSDVVGDLIKAGVRVVFFPHANIAEYVDAGLFSVPDGIEYGHNGDGASIQDYLANASLFITDYSSASFDAAYVGCPCIYYQFDQEEYFSTGHHSVRGYFDDERDGFGPVVTNGEDLDREVRDVWARNFILEPLYAQRGESTFKFRDGRCCERVYRAITSLHDPVPLVQLSSALKGDTALEAN
ncbi:bifunctional glycosyltransferase/CDP-glycerol:glycerophosphate glycerophosphotransferase [Adlercreutzia muris]|uniref:bifunctional glycosyltransferase/CDP-glycerol:glycerophosphate glycerophosphotransferase n=1 Tax=Adlercreutzia muris TaxID=1796610 RepID=UPI0035132FDB